MSLRKPKEFADCAQPREPCAQNTKMANSAKGRIKTTYRSALDAAGPGRAAAIPFVACLTPAATLRASFECEAEITARARRQVNHVSVLKLGFYALWFLEDYSFWSRLGRPSTDRKDSLLRMAARTSIARPIDDAIRSREKCLKLRDFYSHLPLKNIWIRLGTGWS